MVGSPTTLVTPRRPVTTNTNGIQSHQGSCVVRPAPGPLEVSWRCKWHAPTAVSFPLTLTTPRFFLLTCVESTTSPRLGLAFPYHIKRPSRARVRSCDVGEHSITSPLLGEGEDNRSEWGKVSLRCGTLSLISPNSPCSGVALTGEYWTSPVPNGMVVHRLVCLF